MGKKLLVAFSALTLLFTQPLLTTAEDFTYPQMADDYFALAKEYPEYFRMQGDSIYFIDHSFLGSSALVVSSQEKFDAMRVKYGYLFTPENSGEYVITLEESYLSSVASGDVVAEVVYKRYYSYTVDVKNNEITVTTQNLYKPDKYIYTLESCINDGEFYSFINGILPNAETGYDRYFIENEQKPNSFFCLNYESTKESQIHNIKSSDNSIASLTMSMSTHSSLNGEDDLMVYVISARKDGEVKITPNSREEYELKIENGLFSFKNEPDIQPEKMGDVNGDLKFSVSDIVYLQRWLLNDPDAKIQNWRLADFYEDQRIDTYDLCIMKKTLQEKSN